MAMHDVIMPLLHDFSDLPDRRKRTLVERRAGAGDRIDLAAPFTVAVRRSIDIQICYQLDGVAVIQKLPDHGAEKCHRGAYGGDI